MELRTLRDVFDLDADELRQTETHDAINRFILRPETSNTERLSALNHMVTEGYDEPPFREEQLDQALADIREASASQLN